MVLGLACYSKIMYDRGGDAAVAKPRFCFLFSFFTVYKLKKKEKGLMQKFGNPFGLFFVTL